MINYLRVNLANTYWVSSMIRCMIGPGQTWSLSWEACVFIEVDDVKYLGWYWILLSASWKIKHHEVVITVWEDGVTQERINVWHEQNLSWDPETWKHIEKNRSL